MAWRKFFKVVDTNGTYGPVNGGRSSKEATGFTNYGSILPQVYMGHPNRIERYNQYEAMNMDSELCAALDILAEFCTQLNEENNTAFKVDFKDSPTDTEAKILKKELQSWYKLNRFERRIFKIFRNVLMYGDQVFLRDPETFELFWTEINNVVKIIVNESRGKEPEQYVLRNINPNFENLTVTQVTTDNMFGMNPNIGGGTGGASTYNPPSSPYSGNSRFTHGLNERTMDAEHIVHLSLTEGLDANWPFGNSILELVFKVYKQKELLEDAILIYRVQRAPERRVFYIDVGNMPSHMAMAFVDRIKNELHQRRIPTHANGSGAQGSGCFSMDTKVPLLDSRILTLTELAKEYEEGKKNWIYSCNPKTGEFVPGLITWAGITKKNEQVVKLTLDNGETIIATPDHKFPIIGKGKVEAKDIIPNVDSLISFNTRLHSISDYKKNNFHDPQYQQVYDHNSNKWKFTHRKVAHFFKDLNIPHEYVYNQKFNKLAKTMIHHFDFNKYNNSPENLFFMNWKDHFQMHGKLSRQFLELLTEEQRQAIIEKRKKTLCNLPEDVKQSRRDRQRIIQKKRYELMSKEQRLTYLRKNQERNSKRMASLTQEEKKKISEEISNRQKKYWIDLRKNSEKYQKRCKKLSENGVHWKNQSLKFNDDLFNIVYKIVKETNLSESKTIDLLNSNQEFLNIYSNLNQPIDGNIVKFDHKKLCRTTFRKLIKDFGFKSWTYFKHSLGQRLNKPNLSLIFNDEILKTIVETAKQKNYKRSEIAKILSLDDEFVGYFKKLNKDNKKYGNKFSENTFCQSLKFFGYKNWSDFKEKLSLYNHKIISIEYLTEKIDVGTLTIDGEEKYHNFHTFALDSGVYTYNSAYVDSTYNPLSINQDFFFPQTADGRGSKVEVLPGGQNLSEIDDLRFFTNKLLRGLRIPSSYLPTGHDDSEITDNDGRLGTALIQEFRFNQYCQRLQNLIVAPLNTEFKAYLKWRGLNIDTSLFDLKFNEPQNFASYRQAELDSSRIQAFSQLEGYPYLSKRWLLKRFLSLSETEMAENDELWKEENHSNNKSEEIGENPELRDIGITPGGIDSNLEDLGGFNPEAIPGEGAPTPPEVGGGAAPGPEEVGAGGAPAAAPLPGPAGQI